MVLREAGIQSPIMVMNADFNAIDLLIEHRLRARSLQPRISTTMDKGRPIPDKLPMVHVEWDSGMKRLGFPVR